MVGKEKTFKELLNEAFPNGVPEHIRKGYMLPCDVNEIVDDLDYFPELKGPGDRY